MRAARSFLLHSLPLLLATPASAQGSNGTGNFTCADGLYIVVARGTTEPAGSGAMGVIGDDVAGRVRDSEVVGLDYPATLSDPIYVESVIDGGRAMKEAVEGYHDACPDGRIAVLGYSQGAQVSLNALCGGGGDSFDDDLTPVSRSIIESSVVAIVLFGDPSHVVNATYNEGTSENKGIFPRLDSTDCEALGPRLRSYCDEGDVYCDRGDDEDVHGEYIQRYGDEVIDFVVSRYEEAANGTSTTTSATSTATSTSGASTSAAETASPTTGTESPSGTDSGAGQPTETDSGASGAFGFGSAWWASLAVAVVWQVL